MKRIWKSSNGASVTIADRRIYTGVPLLDFGYDVCISFDTRRDLSGIMERERLCGECLSNLENGLGILADNPGSGHILDLGPAYDCWMASAEFSSSSPWEVARTLGEGAQFMSKYEIPDSMMLGKIFGKVKEGKYSIVLYARGMEDACCAGREMDRVFRASSEKNGYTGRLLGCGCEGILMPIVGPSNEWRGRRTPIISSGSEMIEDTSGRLYDYLHV